MEEFRLDAESASASHMPARVGYLCSRSRDVQLPRPHWSERRLVSDEMGSRMLGARGAPVADPGQRNHPRRQAEALEAPLTEKYPILGVVVTKEWSSCETCNSLQQPEVL